MKQFLILVGILVAIAATGFWFSVSFAAPFPYAVGGTGSSTIPALGQLFYAGATAWQSEGTSTVTNGTGISFSGTPGALVGGTSLTITNSGVTSITATSPISRDSATGAVTISCPTCSTNNWLYPFTYATTYNTLSAGTSTPLWLRAAPLSLFASSTVVFSNSTTTQEAEGTDTVNAWAGRISPTKTLVLGTATTTTWTGTSTGPYVPYVVAPFAGTLRQVTCQASTTLAFLGTSIDINGTPITPSYFISSSTKGVIAITGSNTFSKGDTIEAWFGTSTTDANANKVSCSILTTETP